MSHTPTPSFFPSSLCYFGACACRVCVYAHAPAYTLPRWFMEEGMCRDQRTNLGVAFRNTSKVSHWSRVHQLGKAVLPVRPHYIPVSTFPALGLWGSATTSGIFTQILAIDLGPHVCRAHSLLNWAIFSAPFLLNSPVFLYFIFFSLEAYQTYKWNLLLNWMWQLRLAIPLLRKMKQEDHHVFESSLGNIVTSRLPRATK